MIRWPTCSRTSPAPGGKDRLYQVYGHALPSVRRGQRIVKGEVVGKIARPVSWHTIHAHVGVSTKPIGEARYCQNERDVDCGGWGRWHGRDREDAIKGAKAQGWLDAAKVY